MKCEICSSPRFLVKHHISYEPEVIQILCRSCHSKLHHPKGLKFGKREKDEVSILFDKFNRLPVEKKRQILVIRFRECLLLFTLR